MTSRKSSFGSQAPGRMFMPLLLAAGLLLCLISLGVGRYPLDLGDVFALLVAGMGGPGHGRDATLEQVFWQLRLPRVLAALMVGAALAASGACLQRVFRNPLAAPELLGVSAGAALGAAIAIVGGAGVLMLQGSAFAGGLIAIALVLGLGPLLPARDRLLGLILTGVAVSSLAGALLAALIAFADPRTSLPAISFWMMGSFSAIDPAALGGLAAALALALVPLVLLRWRIDALALGDDEAHAMGVAPHRTRRWVVVLAALATSAAVAVAGVIGWVGLIVPHLARMLVGAAFSRWLGVSALLGAVFMLLIDTLSRAVGDIELPPGVWAALLGAPALFLLMRRGNR